MKKLLKIKGTLTGRFNGKDSGMSIKFPSPINSIPPSLGSFADDEDDAPAHDNNRYVQYALNGPGYLPTPRTVRKVPPAIYKIEVIRDCPTLVPAEIVTDNLIRFPDAKSDLVINEIVEFWKLKDEFARYGYAHKRGYLLWGVQGCHAAGTELLMHDGRLQKVEDIRPGDQLMGPDSEPRTVQSLCGGFDDLYRVVPSLGESFVVNGQHVLSVVAPDGATRNLEVEEFLRESPEYRRQCALYRPDRVRFPDGREIQPANRLRALTVEPAGRDRYYGFTLDRDHLYLMADFTVTHNSGKTCTVKSICHDMISRKGIVLLLDTRPVVVANVLQDIRQVEPNRPVVVVLEDIDALIEEHGESTILSILDGEKSIDNVVYIATTNYPEKLDGRVVNRPSRFDRVVKIGLPSPECRQIYLASRKLPLSEGELTKWVENTEGLSIAHLKELILSVFCFRNDFDAELKRLRRMARLPKSDDPGQEVGFGGDRFD